MPLPNEQTAVLDGRRRDRAYSDAHALVCSNANSQDTPATTMGITDTINKANALSNYKMTCSKKLHSQHHHHGNRPRSKSCDLHRHRHHSTPVHKKQYPHQYKHIPLAHSGPIHHGRNSPTFPKVLKGKMWIRPAATRSPMSFSPALARVAPTPAANEHQQVDNGGFMNMSPLNNVSTACQVTGGSSSPTSLDDEMMLYTSLPTTHFDPPHQRQHTGPTRIIFGESGKPIKPRTAIT